MLLQNYRVLSSILKTHILRKKDLQRTHNLFNFVTNEHFRYLTIILHITYNSQWRLIGPTKCVTNNFRAQGNWFSLV
jgi:hypothetical protein